MQDLPYDVLAKILPALPAIGAAQRQAVRAVELARMDRKGSAAARAAGMGGYARGHIQIMSSMGYPSSLNNDSDDDDSCSDCGYSECRCDYHCAACDAEYCEGGDCGCNCGNCDWEDDEDD